jgi:chromosome segregation ATPase
MLTKEDLKKIEELLQPKFDHIELRLDEHDKRFDLIDKKLGEHDKKFAEVERRLDNIVEVVAFHTTLLKDINLRLISVEGNVERMSLSIENIWSKLSLLSAKIKVQEDKTNTFNMLLDKGKNQYK